MHSINKMDEVATLIYRSAKDYYEITKPKVVALILLTALVGMFLAKGVHELPSLITVFEALVGIGLLSAAAAAINHVVDYRIDIKMARTYNRPVAKGRLSQSSAMIFAGILAIFGFTLLLLRVNALTAWLTLASLVGYALIYTVFLKRATPQNIVIGGLAGAMPPLLGWVAITGQFEPNALLLVILIFTWTPPHFWALAIHREADYKKANIPMLPVTHGREFTKTMVLLYAMLLVVVGVFPWLFGLSGFFYLICAVLLNGYFCYLAFCLKYKETPQSAWRLFKFSIVHLMVLFVVLLVDPFLSSM